jgi:hypothetical protein
MLAGVLQSMWQDVMKALVTKQEQEDARALAPVPVPVAPSPPPPTNDGLSDDLILSLVTTALVRAEQTSGRANAQSLRDMLHDVKAQVSGVGAAVAQMRAAADEGARRQEDLAERTRGAIVAAEDARTTAQGVAAALAERVNTVEATLTSAVDDLRREMSSSLTAMGDAVSSSSSAAASLKGPAGSVDGEAIRDAVLGEVQPTVALLADELAQIRAALSETEEKRRKDARRAEEAERRAAEAERQAAAAAHAAANAAATANGQPPPPPPPPPGPAPEVLDQMARLADTIAAMQAEIADLKARPSGRAGTFGLGMGMGMGMDDDGAEADRGEGGDGDNDDDGDEAGRLPGHFTAIPTGVYVATHARRGGAGAVYGSSSSPSLMSPRRDSADDLEEQLLRADIAELSAGEVLLTDDFEPGDVVRLVPLVRGVGTGGRAGTGTGMGAMGTGIGLLSVTGASAVARTPGRTTPSP